MLLYTNFTSIYLSEISVSVLVKIVLEDILQCHTFKFINVDSEEETFHLQLHV